MWVRNVVTLSLCAAMLSGCLGGSPDNTGVVFEQTNLDGLTVQLTLDSEQAFIGQLFNFTIDAVDDEAMAHEADEAHGNATDGNATASQEEGNATMENATASPFADARWSLVIVSVEDVAENATAEPAMGNATTDNATEEPEPVGRFEGVGLPVSIGFLFEEVGTYNVTATVNADGYSTGRVSALVDAIEEALEVVEEVAPVDPCAGVPVQEPVEFSDIFVGAAVLGTGVYQGHTFEVGDCQTTIFVEITTTGAYVDPMLRLKDNTGAEVDAEDNEFEFHDTLTYEPGGYLAPGTWQIDARGYAAGPGPYEITVNFELP